MTEDDVYGRDWADGNSLTVKGGELKALLDVRDGNEAQNGSPNYKGVPYYIKKLNQFVQTILFFTIIVLLP